MCLSINTGDWGGNDPVPGYTPEQMATSVGMNKIASELGSEFVVALGDNFYEAGISTDENSERFQQTWEDVYTGKFLQTPWYVTAGNHGK